MASDVPRRTRPVAMVRRRSAIRMSVVSMSALRM